MRKDRDPSTYLSHRIVAAQTHYGLTPDQALRFATIENRPVHKWPMTIQGQAVRAMEIKGTSSGACLRQLLIKHVTTSPATEDKQRQTKRRV